MSNNNSGFVAWAGLVLALLALVTVGYLSIAPKGIAGTTYTSGGPTFNAGALFPNGLIIGPPGTPATKAIFAGTCNLIGTTAIAATSTTSYDCQILNPSGGNAVFSGDFVSMIPPSTFPVTPQLGFYVVRAQASTTSGYATVVIANISGAATSTATRTLLNGWRYVVRRQ